MHSGNTLMTEGNGATDRGAVACFGVLSARRDKVGGLLAS